MKDYFECLSHRFSLELADPPSSLLPMATYSLPPSWKKHYGFWDENDTL